MAKLFLKFEQAVLKEIPLSQGVTTIGRLPDNLIQVDNLAVSGHHAKIYWDNEKYIIEDNNSLNGTYVNNARVNRRALKDGDNVLIGKHILSFREDWREDRSGQAAKAIPQAPLAKLDPTVPLDAMGIKDRLSMATPAQAGIAEGGASPTRQYSTISSPEKTGTLTILSGKTDDTHYVLNNKMNVIGKSEMASIKLKGWFSPKMAALISKRENGYFIAASEKNIKVKINGEEIAGQRALAEGDVIEVAGIKMTFGYQT
jgi:pSer/pThr/pTyr-binding forkhead associated (FHA) protein